MMTLKRAVFYGTSDKQITCDDVKGFVAQQLEGQWPFLFTELKAYSDSFTPLWLWYAEVDFPIEIPDHRDGRPDARTLTPLEIANREGHES